MSDSQNALRKFVGDGLSSLILQTDNCSVFGNHFSGFGHISPVFMTLVNPNLLSDWIACAIITDPVTKACLLGLGIYAETAAKAVISIFFSECSHYLLIENQSDFI